MPSWLNSEGNNRAQSLVGRAATGAPRLEHILANALPRAASLLAPQRGRRNKRRKPDVNKWRAPHDTSDTTARHELKCSRAARASQNWGVESIIDAKGHATGDAPMLDILINIFTAPGDAYRQIRIKPTIVLPLLLVIGGAALVQTAYMQTVDMDFFIDSNIAAMGEDAPADQRAQARSFMQSSGRQGMLTAAIVSSVIVLSVVQLVYAAYLHLLAKSVAKTDVKYTGWLSFSLWSSMPVLLSFVATLVNLAMSPDGMIAPQAVNPLALSALLGPSENTSLTQWLTSVDITMFWSLAIMTVGFRQWTQCSWTTSAISVAVPYLLIFGIWLGVAL